MRTAALRSQPSTRRLDGEVFDRSELPPVHQRRLSIAMIGYSPTTPQPRVAREESWVASPPTCRYLSTATSPGPRGEIDWFKNNPDPEFEEFSLERAQGDSTLLFGRTTYEMMVERVADRRGARRSAGHGRRHGEEPEDRVLEVAAQGRGRPRWQNVELRHDIDGEALRTEDRDFTTLGSGSVVQQLTQLGLVEEYTFVVNPVVLGGARDAFAGSRHFRARADGATVVQERSRLAHLRKSLTGWGLPCRRAHRLLHVSTCVRERRRTSPRGESRLCECVVLRHTRAPARRVDDAAARPIARPASASARR